MNRKIASIAASVLVFAFVAPSATGVLARTAHHHGVTAARPAASLPKAPADPWAKQDKKYKGQTITYYGGSVGTDHLADVPLVKAFEKSTGIKVKVVEQPSTGDAALAQLERTFSQGSSSIDVSRIDVVWPGTLGKYLLPLSKPLAANRKLEYPSILKNDTVNGKLVAMPYQGDFGMLYYRPSLLKKYGYSKPPTTWTQLTAMAKKIQAGEQKSNKNFYGFVFQGKSYEGLTCNALEWLASSGGGTFITHSGKVTINNAKAAKALTVVQRWVGTISPKGVTAYDEGATQNAWTAGDAAFARNWPYMDSPAILKGSKVANDTAVAPLPHGPGGSSVATTGGWQIAVSKFTKHKGAALAWARYYSSKPVQIWRGTYAGIVPTMPSVNNVASVKKVQPYLTTVGNHTTRVTRPTILGGNYAKGSADIYQGINSILTGSDVSGTLSVVQKELTALKP